MDETLLLILLFLKFKRWFYSRESHSLDSFFRNADFKDRAKGVEALFTRLGDETVIGAVFASFHSFL